MSSSGWWYHSLLKPTANVNFSSGRLAKGAVNKEAREVLRELTRARIALLDKLNVPSSPQETIVRACDEYIELAQGLLAPAPTSNNTTSAPTQYPVENTTQSTNPVPATSVDAGSGDVSLRKRYTTLFKWRDSVSKEVKDYTDVQADIVCMLIDVGLWHCLHAATLGTDKASREDEETSKKIYHCYRGAASYFENIHRDQLSKLSFEPNTDFDERIIKAMAIQCLAEAQEVTTDRARRKGYKPHLIAGLARDEYDRFNEALTLVNTMDRSYVAVIRSYLQFKAQYYAAYSYCYQGKHLFDEEKVGSAIKAFRQANQALNACQLRAEEFQKSLAKSGGSSAKNEEGFVELAKEIKRSLEKAEHENGFIYHQKVPIEDEPMVAPHALVECPVYQTPQISSLWNEAKFDCQKIPLKGQDKASDIASSDGEKIKTGKNHVTGKQDECVIL
eukprot:m.13464 g.13464  ORF g.13464 m.13464 type:complete len:446 (-) comp4860_c0_seq1:83-1420(-)